jgi:hypothetical protein
MRALATCKGLELDELEECEDGWPASLPFCADVHGQELRSVHPGDTVSGGAINKHEEEEECDGRSTGGFLLRCSLTRWSARAGVVVKVGIY